jgi:hypothetical protein
MILQELVLFLLVKDVIFKTSTGRFENEECRDSTPDYFHLALTNYIGRFEKSFVADIFADYEVWNHPVVSYKILEQRKISPEEAMKEFFPAANSTVYTFNQNVKSLLFVQTKMYFVTESDENISGLKGKLYSRIRRRRKHCWW